MLDLANYLEKAYVSLNKVIVKILQSFATDIVHYAIDSRFCHDVLAEKKHKSGFFLLK